jgi:hypothetical protein
VQAGAIYEQELHVPADLAELPRIRNFAVAVAAHCGFDRVDRASVATAVHEAVALRGDPAPRRTVSVRALWCGGKLTFYVRSPGRLEPGLGMDLMRSLTADLQVVPGASGTTVRLSV